MTARENVRYLRCDGPLIKQDPPGTEALVVRIARRGENDWFGGYVALNADGEVIEKSSNYGAWEGDASGFEIEAGCRAASRQDFEAAWERPYAQRSLRRRFLSSLNGADDSSRPDDGSL